MSYRLPQSPSLSLRRLSNQRLRRRGQSTASTTQRQAVSSQCAPLADRGIGSVEQVYRDPDAVLH